MALAPVISYLGPRDRLERLVALGRKTRRNWLVVAIYAGLGAAVSFGFAMTRSRSYQASATLSYEERIQSSLLQNREESVQRNLGDRYRELLLAHDQLVPVLADPTTNPYPQITDQQIAIDKLRSVVRFESRGPNTFRITYADDDPDRAKLVTQKLAKLLQDKDDAIRNEQAHATVTFATQQKEEATTELRKREQVLAEFLAKHPEFAQESNQQGEGAGIRAIRNQKTGETGSARMYALERQRQRIQARLDAPPDAPPIRITAPPTAEKLAAEAAAGEAQRELAAANRELEEALSKYTDKHPTVIKAQERVAAAQTRLRHAQAAVPADVEMPLAPATPADRTKLQKELANLDSQIADEQKRTGKGATQAATDAGTNWIVQLETQHDELRRAVGEQRERVGTLANSVSRAQTDADQKIAEQGRLRVINPAEKPTRPSGPGKTIFLLAGMALFLMLGLAHAVGAAVIDDRLYRRADIDQLGVAVLAVIPAQAAPPRRRKRSG